MMPVLKANAAEFYTPMQPGVSTGVPAGALPPVGLYGVVDTYQLSGTVKNGEGKDFGPKISGSDVTPQLLYVPGYKFLGASYGAMLTQPFNFNTIKVTGGATGPSSFSGGGMFNTILTPEILSWSLGGGHFVSEGLSLYLPDGDFRHIGSNESADSIANNYFTFEPNFAYSYLGGGWNITLNNTLDFNTKDNTTHYQSGDIYYLDWTVAHSFGPVSAGLIGNYIQQFTGDTQFGAPVPNTASSGTGNEYMHASIGPILAYNLGKATITFRYLNGFAGKNGGNPSFFHFGVSFKIF
jgi:hypothetical protein